MCSPLFGITKKRKGAHAPPLERTSELTKSCYCAAVPHPAFPLAPTLAMAEDEAPALEAPPQLHTLAATASAVMPALPLAGAGVPLVHAIPLERPPQAAPSAVPPPPVVASTVAPAPRPAPPRPAVVASRLALLASQAALPPAAAPTPSAGLENSIADVMVNRGPAAAKGEGGHTCELCGAVFAQSRYLADHRRTHSQASASLLARAACAQRRRPCRTAAPRAVSADRAPRPPPLPVPVRASAPPPPSLPADSATQVRPVRRRLQALRRPH